MGFLEKVFGNYSQKEIKRLQPTVNKVLALENEFAAMSDAELRGMTDKLRRVWQMVKPSTIFCLRLLPPVGKPAGVCWK